MSRLRAALFVPLLAFAVAAVLISPLNPAASPRLWLARHALTLAAGLGAAVCWPPYLREAGR